MLIALKRFSTSEFSPIKFSSLKDFLNIQNKSSG